MKSLTLRLSMLLLCLLPCFCRAQNTGKFLPVGTAAAAQEKIYIHYDKAVYLPGDTVWFKAYLYNGSTRSKLSHNFYFELLTDKGRVLQRVTAPIFESTASGQVVLPADTAAKQLYCRAYTALTLRDTGFIYMQPLTIHGLRQANALKNNIASIRFLPESGNWVNGLPALMALKATDGNGLPVEATGVINCNGKLVTEFATRHDGMGEFTILPKRGEEYAAVWKDASGATHSTQLPQTMQEGIGMHVSDVPQGKKYFIFRSPLADEDDKQLSLTASINNFMVYRAQINLSADSGTNGTIPIKGMPSGIMHITLYNKKMQPLAERITFVNNHDYTFNIDTGLIAIDKKKRGLNQVRIAAPDTLRTNISVSITDADINPSAAYGDNIISHLLLCGDLRGNIINPYYYFANANETTARNLDLVMLTNGWRRYNWNTKPELTPPSDQNFLAINGKLTGLNPSVFAASPPVNIILQTSDSSSVLIPATLDKTGNFYKDGYIFYGDARVFFKSTDKTLKAAAFKALVNNGLLDTLRQNTTLPWKSIPAKSTDSIALYIPPEMKAYLPGRNVKALKEVVITGKKETEIEKLDKAFTGGLFSGGFNFKNIDFRTEKQKVNYFSIFQYLKANVPGLRVYNEGSIYPYATWRLGPGGELPVTFFLNNYKCSPSDISRVNIEEFEYVKIYNPDETGVFGVPGGIVAVYTKKGKGLITSKDNSVAASLNGYTPVLEFYSPDYASILNNKPDYRSTLYWNPNLILDKDKREQIIKFYNNDMTRKFRIVLEGMNFGGKLVYMEKVL